MARRKGLSYEEKMINALKSLPNPIDDKRHNILIHFVDDRARSNESRFEHIISGRHELLPSDIKRIQRYIRKSLFMKDKEKKDTFNYYIERNSYGIEYIKVSVKLTKDKPQDAYVRTIFITKVIK